MSIEVIASDKSADQDELWGLALKASDIEATHARLREQGVEISNIRDGRKPGTRVCTAKSHTLGVPTLLIEHPLRDASASQLTPPKTQFATRGLHGYRGCGAFRAGH